MDQRTHVQWFICVALNIFIHKNSFLKMLPRFDVFLPEILLIVKSFNNKTFLKAYDDIFILIEVLFIYVMLLYFDIFSSFNKN